MSDRGPRLALGAATHAARVVVNVGSVLVLTPLTIHALGVAGFGAWAVAMTALSLLLFLELGAVTLITKVAAQERGRASGREGEVTRALRRALVVRALIAAAVAWAAAPALARAFVGDHGPALEASLRQVALATLVLLPLSLDPGRLQGRGEHLAFNAVSIAGRLLQVALTWVALARSPTLGAAVGATLLAMVATAVGHLAAARWTAPPASGDAPAAAGDLRHEARAFGAINLAVLISTQSGVLLAGVLLGPAAAGLYRLADRVTHHLAVFLKQLGAVIGPEVAASAAAGQQERLRSLFVAGCRWTLLLGTPPLLLLVAWGDWLLGAWVGPEGAAAGGLAAGLWAATLLSLVQSQAVTLLVYGGAQARVARAFVLTALLDVAASAALASWFGVWGVVAGTVCTVSAVDLGWFLPAGCRRVGLTLPGLLRATAGPSVAPLLAFALAVGLARVAAPAPTLAEGCALLALLGASFVAGLGRWGLTADERAAARNGLQAVRRLAGGLLSKASGAGASQIEGPRLQTAER